MSRKRIFFLISLCLIVAFLVITFWVKPQTKAEWEPKRHIWGYVTYEGNRDYEDEVGIWEDQQTGPLRTVPINEAGSNYKYTGLFPPPGYEEGWYWVKGKGRLSESPWYHVYWVPEEDLRQDLLMYPYEPDK
jgi:hypothetical protein